MITGRIHHHLCLLALFDKLAGDNAGYFEQGEVVGIAQSAGTVMRMAAQPGLSALRDRMVGVLWRFWVGGAKRSPAGV
ncbi:hypothetical protein Barb7_02799 [Bacteroidales bacterium Barb7]|nr:hypothetical protein Barb7_02799 [Bacteroidales bacterium Barb7]